MVPQSAQIDLNDADLKTYGFIDLNTFAITAELIDEVQTVTSALTTMGIDTMREFARLVSLTLDSAGPSVQSLVDTDFLDQLRAKPVSLYNLPAAASCPIDVAGWITDALGLSSNVLCSSMTFRTPLKFLEAYAGTMHLGANAVVVSVQCPSCLGMFLVCAGPYGSHEDIRGAAAYRFSGLKYELALQGGVGVLIKDGRTVGRFLWVSPTCACSKITGFELHLEAVMLPRQNHYNYGEQHDAEWAPVAQKRALASKGQE
ncbi:hypothetical protein BJY01DRAFT_254437 [Aspergillus pseudoustus]|uniref:Uncharacterized protein n=1 Tax=Aspergillus pseudoustus TaxID=1810923 RepID=A0ABR4IT92_9EURO